MSKQEELLRKLRGHLAYAKGVKPYVIFKDEQLNDILKSKPKNIEALSKLKGFPKDGARVEKWGQAIVDIFNKTESIEDFEVKLDENGEPQAKSRLKRMSIF